VDHLGEIRRRYREEEEEEEEGEGRGREKEGRREEGGEDWEEPVS
jgi:hypothetical protein